MAKLNTEDMLNDLRDMVDRKRGVKKAQNLGPRDVSKQSGVSKSTVNRLLNGKPIDLENLLN